jgi:phage terminase small subunit
MTTKSAPKPPESIKGRKAMALWRSVVEELDARGLYSPARAPMVGSYVHAAVALGEAQARADAAGPDADQAMLNAVDRHQKRMLAAARSIGLAATSQIRSKPEPADAADHDADAADDWHRAANRALGLLQ